MDLQEIYLMLRLQAAVLCQSQQKEVHQQQQQQKYQQLNQQKHHQLLQRQQSSPQEQHQQSLPQEQQPKPSPCSFNHQHHSWDAVKERMKKCNNLKEREAPSQLSQSTVFARPVEIGPNNSINSIHALDDCLEEETESSSNVVVL